jgi:hypothetical protein
VARLPCASSSGTAPRCCSPSSWTERRDRRHSINTHRTEDLSLPCQSCCCALTPCAVSSCSSACGQRVYRDAAAVHCVKRRFRDEYSSRANVAEPQLAMLLLAKLAHQAARGPSGALQVGDERTHRNDTPNASSVQPARSTRAEPDSMMRGIWGKCWRAPAVDDPVNTAIPAPAQNGATAPHRSMTAEAA